MNRIEQMSKIYESQKGIYEKLDRMNYEEVTTLFSIIAGKLSREYPEKFIEMVEALPEAFPEPWIMKSGHE